MRKSVNINLEEIPVVDIASLVDARASVASKQKTADKIGEICRRSGFFYVKNHGISEREIAEIFAETKHFFDLPIEKKMEIHIGKSPQFRGYVPLGGEVTEGKVDWHECIDLQPKLRDRRAGEKSDDHSQNGKHPLDDPEQWVEDLPVFRKIMMRTWDQMNYISEKITEGFALSLGLEAQYFKPFTGDALCSLRLAHYPVYDENTELGKIEAGFGTHCDSGFLAILLQDDVGGLEILNANDEWIPAPRIPDMFIVNIGLMMQRWTNDRYRATWHRVTLPRKKSRYAIPFFFEPRYNAVVEPLKVCCDAENPPKYEACVFGEYLTNRFSKAYDTNSNLLVGALAEKGSD